jgi:MinD-like ATPase involved in chromosome partitioning or flagellar assembly
LDAARKGIPAVNLHPSSALADDIKAIAANIMSGPIDKNSGSIKFFVERVAKTI